MMENTPNEQAIYDETYFGLHNVKEYIGEPAHFHRLDQVLASQIRPLCPKDADTAALTDALTDRLVAIEPERDRSILRKTVSKWMQGKVQSITRTTAIKICFALDMDRTAADVFLKEGLQLPGLRARTAGEAICIYCLSNHRPLHEAKALYERFQSDSPAEIKARKTQPILGHGMTTQVLSDMAGQEWADPEEFYRECLEARRKDYLGFSKTVISTYYGEKHRLIEQMVSQEIAPWTYSHVRSNDWELDGEVRLEGEARAFFKALKKKGVFVTNQPLDKPFVHAESFREAWDRAMEACRAEPGYVALLSRHIPMKQLLRYCLGHPMEKATELSRQMTTTFPLYDYFKAFEQNPQNKESELYVRQMILLLFTANYLYGWENPEDQSTPDDKNDMDFREQLDDTLEACNLEQLDPTFPLDWLMLLSVYYYYCKRQDGDQIDPLGFFKGIIAELVRCQDESGSDGE